MIDTQRAAMSDEPSSSSSQSLTPAAAAAAPIARELRPINKTIAIAAAATTTAEKVGDDAPKTLRTDRGGGKDEEITIPTNAKSREKWEVVT